MDNFRKIIAGPMRGDLAILMLFEGKAKQEVSFTVNMFEGSAPIDVNIDKVFRIEQDLSHRDNKCTRFNILGLCAGDDEVHSKVYFMVLGYTDISDVSDRGVIKFEVIK